MWVTWGDNRVIDTYSIGLDYKSKCCLPTIKVTITKVSAEHCQDMAISATSKDPGNSAIQIYRSHWRLQTRNWLETAPLETLSCLILDKFWSSDVEKWRRPLLSAWALSMLIWQGSNYENNRAGDNVKSMKSLGTEVSHRGSWADHRIDGLG